MYFFSCITSIFIFLTIIGTFYDTICKKSSKSNETNRNSHKIGTNNALSSELLYLIDDDNQIITMSDNEFIDDITFINRSIEKKGLINIYDLLELNSWYLF